MHCVNCDRLLSDYEATRKHAITFKFLDLCKVCFDDVKTIIPVIDRKELMTEHDLDDPEDDFDGDNLSTGADVEDFDDLISNYREDSIDFDER